MWLLNNLLTKYQHEFKPIIKMAPGEHMIKLDLGIKNKNLTRFVYNSADVFQQYIRQMMDQSGATYAWGGYLEDRPIYAQRKGFDGRTIHLGVDIWAPAGTLINAPLGGFVHSFAHNRGWGNYGPTLILTHQVEGFAFQALYGHLSEDSLRYNETYYIALGEPIAELGTEQENGGYPPHLHFQLILDMETWRGDYPGICKPEEVEFYAANCPDPELILQLENYTRNQPAKLG